jgi:hypothetical protein
MLLRYVAVGLPFLFCLFDRFRWVKVGKQAPLNSKDYRWVEVVSRINKTDRDGQLVDTHGYVQLQAEALGCYLLTLFIKVCTLEVSNRT